MPVDEHGRTVAPQPPVRPRREGYTARVVIFEQPSVAEKLNALAQRHGHTLGAEVRGAIREHLERVER